MRALLREALAAAVVSGLVFQALRHWGADRYVVPSHSMQPCLFGAARGGDIVLVDKLASASKLQRYDLGVFRREGATADLVKRVVSLGDEWIELRDGDLFVGPSPQHLVRAVKHPLADRDLRVRWLQWPLPADAATDAEPESLTDFLSAPRSETSGLEVPSFSSADAARTACTEVSRRAARDGELPTTGSEGTWLATVRAVDATYLDARSQRGHEGQSLVVADFGADLTFRSGTATALLSAIELRPDSWVFHWDLRSGRRELWRNGETVATCDRPLPTRSATDERPVRVEFGHLDGTFFHAVDGDEASLWTVTMRSEWLTADPGPTAWPLPKNRLALAVLGPDAMPLSSLLVFRDLHWFRPPLEVGTPASQFVASKHVPIGSVYLLGDNAVDSNDSRMFGPVPLAAFVGRPCAVLGPWPRTRMLQR